MAKRPSAWSAFLSTLKLPLSSTILPHMKYWLRVKRRGVWW